MRYTFNEFESLAVECLNRAALAAQDLGVGLRRPCQGQAFGGMHVAMARIAPARPPTPR